jgi:anti-sigma factor RsiW
MTCHEMEERLDDWVDGALPREEKQEVQEHLASCAACRQQEAALRQLLTHAAALPRSVLPPHDLWPGIAERVDRQGSWSWSWIGGWQPALAVAAVVALAVGAVLFGRPSTSPVHTVVIPSPGVPEEARVRPAAMRANDGLSALESEYQVAADALMKALLEREDDLEPETLARIQHNLAVIDAALAEIHRALEMDPGRPELERQLLSTHRKRVDALRQMVKLSTTL